MNEQYLNIGHIGLADKVLGSGNRLVLWVAGCPFRCQGCIQPDYLPKNSGKDISIPELTSIVNRYLNQIDGITISGGEPFWQADALKAFIDSIPSTLDKMVFTGYRIDELNEKQLHCLSKFDLVVDGRFQQDKKGDYLWRGSDNQKFYSPTNKYSNIDIKNYTNSPNAGLDIIINDDAIFFYGIQTAEEIKYITSELDRHLEIV